jgi:hypothetical protein
MTVPTRHDEPIRSPVSIGVSAVHLAAYLLLVFRSPYLQGTYVVIAMGFLLSQCSLATILSTRSPVPKVISIPLPWFAAVLCWYGLSKTLFWGLGESVADWWAIAITFQVVATIIGMRVIQGSMHRTTESAPSPSKENPTAFQFPIRSLMFWTTLAAFGFAIVMMGERNRMWSGDSVDASESVMMALTGLMLALIGVLCVIALSQKSVAQVCLGLLCVILCVTCCSWLLTRGSLWTGLDASISATAAMTFFSTHAICTAVSLALIWGLNWSLNEAGHVRVGQRSDKA